MVIEMARGDVYCVPLALFIDGQPTDILMDEVYFTVKKHHYNHEALLQKCISNGGIVPDNEGSYVLTINPEDTDGLDFGTYEFDIEVVKLPGIKRTFVGEFILTSEVTHRSNEVEST